VRKVKRAEEAKKKQNTAKKKKKEAEKVRSGRRKRPRRLPLAMPTSRIFHRGGRRSAADTAEQPRTPSHSLSQ
jgi:hypothetical protein